MFNVSAEVIRRLTLIGALLLTVVGCSAGTPAASLPAGDLVVGMITSLSGIALSNGVDARLGAQLAVDEVNQSGALGGRRAKLLVVDDQSTAAGAVAGFGQLGAARAIGIVGPVSPEGVSAVQALAAPSRLPLISLSGADLLLGPGSRPPVNLFLAAPSASRSAERMLDYARASSLTTVAVAHESGDPFADSAVAALVREAPGRGVTIAVDESFDPSRVDFDPLVKRLRASGARALLAWGRGGGAALLTRAWVAFGPGAPILLGPAGSSTAFLRTVGDRGEGALVVASRSVLLESSEAALPRAVGEMAREFNRRNGYYPSQSAFDGYAGARLLLRSVMVAGSAAPGPVSAALGRLSLETAAGTFRYTAGDHLGLPVNALAIAVVRNGRLAPV